MSAHDHDSDYSPEFLGIVRSAPTQEDINQARESWDNIFQSAVSVELFFNK